MKDPAALAAEEAERLCRQQRLSTSYNTGWLTAALLAAERRGAERALAAVQKWGEDREEAEVLYCVEQVRAGKVTGDYS